MEACGIARALDDLEPQSLTCRSAGGDLALVASVGEQMLEPRKAATDAGADQPQAIAVLNAGRMNDQPQRQAQRVGEQMALAAIDGRAVDPVRAAESARKSGPIGIFLPAS